MEKHLTDTQLSLLIDGEVGGKERRGWEAHLSKCPFCRARLEELAALRDILEASIPPILEEHRPLVWSRVRKRLPQARKRCPLRPENFVWPGVLTLVYGMVMLLFLILMIAGVAGFFGWSVPLVGEISYVWSILLEVITVAALGSAGMALSVLGSVSGASGWLSAISGVGMEMILLLGIAGLYIIWIESLDSGSSLKRS